MPVWKCHVSADEDIDADIVQGLRSREPAIDVLDVKTAGLRGTADPALLDLAAQQDRILITYDRDTMPRHFRERLDAGKTAPSVFIFPQEQSAVGEIIETLLLGWTVSHADEWRNQIVYLPFRASHLVAEQKTVTGWVLDSACAFTQGLKKTISVDCAISCAKKGSPLVILQDDGSVYWPIAQTVPAEGQNSLLMPFAGKPVTATGKAYKRGGSNAIVIDKIAEASN